MPSIRPYKNQVSWDVLADCKLSTWAVIGGLLLLSSEMII